MVPTLPFQLLERYDVIEEIGRGGHAVVYRAHDRVLTRDVAVKILREDVLIPEIRARFTQEIQLLATLQHAHILHVHDSGSYGNRPFVVMELAPSQTLAHRLAREPQLPILDAVSIARDVASALAHAHARAVLHRDVKPENILLGPGGAILADFGIARVTGEMAISRITSTGEAVGTLAYMSPEQLCAEQIDARSDQYSLACVLYEMLAGVRPHTAATFEGLRALRLTARHAPVSVYRPSVPPMLEEVLNRAMAVTAADRFRSMDELLMALDLMRTGDAPVSSGSFARVTQSAAVPASTAPSAARTRWPIAAALVVAVLGGAALLNGTRTGATSGDLGGAGGLAVSLAAAADPLADSLRSRVARELSAWSGVRLVSDADAPLRLTLAATALADSVQLRLESRGPSGSLSVARIVARAALPSADATIAVMTREALAGRPASEVPGLDGIPERSLSALRAYVRGHTLLRAGQLDSAARAFREVRDTLPRFAQARFWAAQSTAWSTPRAVDRWQGDADEAVRLGTMRGVDSLLAAGLQRMAAMDFVGACGAYREAVKLTADFVPWIGLGRCQELDSLVQFGGRSRRFRSSHWSALQSYRSAMSTVPTAELLSQLFGFAERVTYSSGVSMRTGLSPARSTVYHALPSLDGDSILLEPVEEVQFSAGQGSGIPPTLTLALRRGRAMLLAMTEEGTTRFPASSEAWLRHAEALELVGRIDGRERTPSGTLSADAALDRVRPQQLDPEGWSRAAIARVRLSLRRGELRIAVDSARQFLTTYSSSTQRSARASQRLAVLTLLTGDQSTYLDLTMEAVRADTSIPAALRDPLHRLEASILFEDCDGSRTWADRVVVQLQNSVPTSLLKQETERRVGRLFKLGVSCLGPGRLTAFAVVVPLDSVYRMLAQGDRSGASRVLRGVRSRRAGATGSAMSWDYLFAEAWALSRVGAEAQASELISGALSDLSSMPSGTLVEPAIVSGLRRAILLYASLAARPEDFESHRKWTEQSRALNLPSS